MPLSMPIARNAFSSLLIANNQIGLERRASSSLLDRFSWGRWLLIESAGGQVGGGSTAAAASLHVEPLASTSTTTTSVSTQTLPSNLAGVNGTTWEDDAGGTCAECTYTVYLIAGGVSTPNSYFLAIWYLTYWRVLQLQGRSWSISTLAAMAPC